MAVCICPACEKQAVWEGYCRPHFWLFNPDYESPGTCAKVGCQKMPVWEGYCKSHFWDANPDYESPGTCAKVGCQKMPVWEGWCKRHSWDANPTAGCQEQRMGNGLCKKRHQDDEEHILNPKRLETKTVVKTPQTFEKDRGTSVPVVPLNATALSYMKRHADQHGAKWEDIHQRHLDACAERLEAKKAGKWLHPHRGLREGGEYYRWIDYKRSKSMRISEPISFQKETVLKSITSITYATLRSRFKTIKNDLKTKRKV